MSSQRSVIPTDSLLQLRQRLDRLPPKSPERATQIASIAQLYGVSVTTVHRVLRLDLKPRTTHRSDHGQPRVLPPSELEHYCELIAALKLRTTNKVRSSSIDGAGNTIARRTWRGYGSRIDPKPQRFTSKTDG